MLSGKAAIAGIGATDFSKNSGRSELRLAAEAVLDALDDAGLAPADVDGLVTFTMDSNLETAVARSTGIGDLTFFSQIGYGGGAIELGGRLPINTHGGQLGEAYIHGMNGIAEGVRQLRGTSVNQVPDVEHVLVTAGTGVPTSGLILG